MKSSLWTREQLAAQQAADRAYTRDWGRAMAAYASDDLREVMDAYNAAMATATARWNRAVKAALKP
jgi:hypothetical protein